MWEFEDPYATHSRLYKNGKAQRDRLEKLRLDKTEEEIAEIVEHRGDTWSEREANEASNRLYYRSIKKQAEGRERRQAIEKKHAPRAPTPSRKIKAEEANKIYERGMLQKLNMEIKREQHSLTKNYVSPILDPLLVDPTKPTTKTLANKTTSTSRVRSRSRLRSMSPNVRSVSQSYNVPTVPCTPPKRPSSVRRQSSTRRSRSSTPLRRVPNTRTRSPTPARKRYYRD